MSLDKLRADIEALATAEKVLNEAKKRLGETLKEAHAEFTPASAMPRLTVGEKVPHLLLADGLGSVRHLYGVIVTDLKEVDTVHTRSTGAKIYEFRVRADRVSWEAL